MNKKRWARVGGIAVAGILIIAATKACKPVTIAPRPIVAGVVGVSEFRREARDSGLFVTVYAGVMPGPLPDTNMTGPPTTVAWFSNQGERGEHERRYDWKPNSQAQYDLVLSNDGSGRTKWTMNEINSVTGVRTPVRSGRLWVCDTKYHASTAREVGFRDCARAVRYDPIEFRLNTVKTQPMSLAGYITSFATYIKGSETRSEERMSPENGPVWISCTSGCCTLGAYQ
jgi:hypothetical protein